ncbi:MAG: DNA polymerase III subunit delta' [Verrucomicrobia bacterium]|nr:DNA polymerase III subunit delta' [Verrucomicrobiota bacterium]MDE3099601.1 DNA polymerase III subunit [Verrucomicrobiota bacterium]
MAFRDFAQNAPAVRLLQRSLARGRLAHAYLFAGERLEDLEVMARTLAKTLFCRHPVRADGAATDSCDTCPNCRKIDGDIHADVHWARPESRSRIITVEQMRDLTREIQLKPAEGGWKVSVIAAAERLGAQAANAFLKTLEEPPPNAVLILLSTEPQRLLETILSRCLRLNFAGDPARGPDAAATEWLQKFGALAGGQKSCLGRYRLLDTLLQKLAEIRAGVEGSLAAASPLEKYDDVETDLREKWENELEAAVEAEYRRRRSELLLLVQWWLRDVWIHALRGNRELLHFPAIAGAETVAKKISPRQALENLHIVEQTQQILHTNVQEALALEVGLLKLNL